MSGQPKKSAIKVYILKNVIGFIFLASHLFAYFLCFNLRFTDDSDPITVAFIISPVMGVFSLAYLRDLLQNINGPSKDDMREVRPSIFIISTAFSLVFCGSTVYLLLTYNSSELGPNDLKLYLSVIELFNGAFIGAIFESLFGYRKPADPPP